MHDELSSGPRLPWWEIAGFVAWGLLVGVLTLTPARGWSPRIAYGCLLCGEFGGADLVRNILMFMPAGVFLARRRVSVLIAVGLGLLLSTGIEAAQLFVPGRHVSPRDIVVNAMGAGAGVVFYRSLAWGLASSSRALLAGTVVAPALVVALTGWLLQPVQTDGIYYAQWVPRRPYYARWNGRLLEAQVDGGRTPIGRLRDTDRVRLALEEGRPVALRLRRGMPTSSLAAVYVLMDDTQREILMVGVDGYDLVVRPRIRAVTLRLDQPDQRFPGYLARRPSEQELQLSLSLDARGRACVHEDGATRCATRASVGAAWGIVLWKGSLPEPLRRLLDALTVALLLLPLAVLAFVQRGARPWLPWAAWGLALALVALAGRAAGLAWPGVPELCAAVAMVAASRTLRSTQRAISAWGSSGSPE